MHCLLNALQIPECYICCQRTYVTAMEAFTILLLIFSYPSRWCDLEAIFGRSKSELTLIFHKDWGDYVRVKTCTISLSCILVESFQFYVQIFGLWPKVASEKQRQVAVSVQTATFVHVYLTKTADRNNQTCRTRLLHNLRRFAKCLRASKACYKI